MNRGRTITGIQESLQTFVVGYVFKNVSFIHTATKAMKPFIRRERYISTPHALSIPNQGQALILLRILECTSYHVVFNVGESSSYFFAGIKDVQRIKYLFCLFKELHHVFTKHMGEVGGADDAVVVFARG